MPNDPFFKDLKLTPRAFEQLVSDRDAVDLVASASSDVQTVAGRANLAQAIINRLLTRQGELIRFGHPNYGSRLHRLVGDSNNTRTRGLAGIYVRECLAQEPRIQEVTEVSFAPPSRGLERDTLQILVRVKPVGDDEELALVIPLQVGG